MLIIGAYPLLLLIMFVLALLNVDRTLSVEFEGIIELKDLIEPLVYEFVEATKALLGNDA